MRRGCTPHRARTAASGAAAPAGFARAARRSERAAAIATARCPVHRATTACACTRRRGGAGKRARRGASTRQCRRPRAADAPGPHAAGVRGSRYPRAGCVCSLRRRAWTRYKHQTNERQTQPADRGRCRTRRSLRRSGDGRSARSGRHQRALGDWAARLGGGSGPAEPRTARLRGGGPRRHRALRSTGRLSGGSSTRAPGRIALPRPPAPLAAAAAGSAKPRPRLQAC